MIDFVILSAYLFEQYSYHRITISYMMPQSEVAFDETIVGGCTSVRQACTEVAILIVDDTVRTRAAASVDRAVLQRVFEEFSRARREREVLVIMVLVGVVPPAAALSLLNAVLDIRLSVSFPSTAAPSRLAPTNVGRLRTDNERAEEGSKCDELHCAERVGQRLEGKSLGHRIPFPCSLLNPLTAVYT